MDFLNFRISLYSTKTQVLVLHSWWPFRLRKKAGLLLSTALVAGFFGSPLLALNECGPDAVGQGVNTCGNATYVGVPNNSAIQYLNSDGLTLNFTSPTTVISGAHRFSGIQLIGENNLTINANNTDITGFGRGISIRHNGTTGAANLNIVDANILAVGTPSSSSYGAFIYIDPTSGADATLTVTNSSIISQGPRSSAGLSVNNAGVGGDASVVLNNTSVEIRALSSPGVISIINNANGTGNASIIMNGGSVLTAQGAAGLSSGGINAQNLGSGDSHVEINGGTIDVRGTGNTVPPGSSSISSLKGGAAAVVGNAFPLQSQNFSSTGTATALMTGGSITTGNMIYANGLSAANWAMGGAHTVMTGGTIVTNGLNSGGVTASTQRNTSNTSDVSVTISGGTVTTNNTNSAGVVAFNIGSGDARINISNGVSITSNGTSGPAVTARSRGDTIVSITGTGTTLTANGTNSSGIKMRQGIAGATSTFDVFVGDGVVVTGGTGVGSAGIEVDSQTGNTGIIQVANGAVVDGTAGRAGIWDKAGDATVTSAGNVRGGITTEAGMDTVNLIAGSLTDGGVDTGSDNDTVNIGSATVGLFATLTGGIVTGSGSDTVFLTGGSVVSGGLNTGSDDDVFEIFSTGGSVANLTGGINAGTGNDTGGLRAGSIVSGDILMNDGSDELTIDGAADITGVTTIDGGDDVSPSDGEIDIVHLNGGVRSFAGGDLVNWETVDLTGGADITFSGSALVTGSAAGIGSFGQPYGLMVQNGAFARFNGNFVVDGNLNNAGTVDLSLDATIGTVLDVRSDYVGTAGSSLLIDVFLEDGGTDNVPANDQAISDQILVTGNGSGTTSVFVTNLGGPGNYTDLNSNNTVDNNEGILFAQVQGTSTAGLFTLGAPVTVGAFTYDLVAFDPGSSQSGFWDYVLANRFSNPSQSYETYPRAVMFSMPTLHQRVGNRHWTGNHQPEVAAMEIFCKDPAQNYRCTITEEQAAYYDDEKFIEEDGSWVRVVASKANVIPTFSTTGAIYDVDTMEVQVGIDRLLRENDNGSKWIGGLNAQISRSSLAGNDPNGVATIDATGVGLGGTLTYYRPNGFYTDLQARIMGVSTDFASAASGSYDGAKSMVVSASVEVGRKFEFENGWRVVPQAQVTYSQARFRDFVDSAGTSVSPDNAESLKVRVGVSAGRERTWEADDGTTRRLETEVGVHLHKELAGRTQVNVSGTPLYNNEGATTVEVTLGATYNWKDDKNSVYGEIGVQTGLRNFGKARRIAGTIGFRKRWD